MAGTSNIPDSNQNIKDIEVAILAEISKTKREILEKINIVAESYENLELAFIKSKSVNDKNIERLTMFSQRHWTFLNKLKEQINNLHQGEGERFSFYERSNSK